MATTSTFFQTGAHEKNRNTGAAQSLGLDGAEEGAGMLHNITKPRPWIGGAQILEDVFEDAQPLKRAQVKRQEWKRHWQVDTPVQLMNEKHWENTALQDLEEALPPIRAEELQRAANC